MFAIPPIPAYAVERPQLCRRLDAALSAPLSVIVAPAGSGKTVLLSQWVASRPDLDFIWMGMDVADQDPRHFIDHLRSVMPTTIRQTPDLAGVHSLHERSLGQPVLDALATVFSEHPGVVLIVDDLHKLANSAVLGDLWWLASEQPTNTRLVCASRIDFSLSLGQHRLRHSLLELRRADLAFDEETTSTVLERIVGAPVSQGTLAAVMARTEGWAAGVLLTALSLRSQPDAERFARQLRGTDRLISEYLSEQALAQQSPARRALLLRLSALDRMSAELVESIMDVDDATALFEDLEHESMFLVAIDSERKWFRFHPLFRELLRYRLNAQKGTGVAAILVAAAEWHLDRGDAPSAIEYFLEARAWDRALGVIVGRSREIFEQCATVSLSRWLETVPAEVRATHPDVEILHGMLLMLTGDAVGGEDRLRRQAERSDLTPHQAAIVSTYLAARVQFRSEPAVALREAKAAATLIREHPHLQPPDLLGLTHPSLLLTAALTSGARAHFLAGDFAMAHEWFDQAFKTSGAHYSPYRVHMLGSLALLEAWSGRLPLADALAEEALSLASGVRRFAHSAPADAYLAAALAAIERGDPRKAALNLHEGRLRAAANHRTQLMWIAHLERILIDREDASLDTRLLMSPPPIVAVALQADEARALRLGRSASGMFRPTTSENWSPLAFEAVASELSNHRPDLAHARLDAAAGGASETTPRAVVEQLALRAWLASSEHGPRAASNTMRLAMELAAQHGLVGVFVRAGPDVLRLVADLPGMPSRFRATVLERARALHHPRTTSAELVEQLTDRELEILAYLPSRMSNGELAERCYVSPNTIKTHMAHIYRKLAVSSRNSAVARAQDLGLL